MVFLYGGNICFVENLSENKNHAHYITIFDIQILVYACTNLLSVWFTVYENQTKIISSVYAVILSYISV